MRIQEIEFSADAKFQEYGDKATLKIRYVADEGEVVDEQAAIKHTIDKVFAGLDYAANKRKPRVAGGAYAPPAPKPEGAK